MMFSFVQIFVGIVIHGAARVRKLAWPDWFTTVSRTVRVVLLVAVNFGTVIPSLPPDLVTLIWQGTDAAVSKGRARERPLIGSGYGERGDCCGYSRVKVMRVIACKSSSRLWTIDCMAATNSRARLRPVRVEFVGLLPTLFAHCEHCMEVMHGAGLQPYSEQFGEYPEEVRRQYMDLSAIAQKLRDEFDGAVEFDAVDAASPLGVWKTIRHGIPRTPCVLVGGKRVFNGLPSYDELRSKVLLALTGSGIERAVS